ncbi:hypothetical protein J3R83DRAFT_7496 [Lanmaoa asiatica]|nr:hypothetical protein J3R83DRAFT_7496 [Lanmaoa asiatica]
MFGMIDFLIACIHSADMHSRFYTLGAVIRLNTPEPEQLVGDPGALLAAMQQSLPGHLNKLLVDYSPARCESMLTIWPFTEHQKAMVQCLQDHGLYKIRLTLAKLISRNEFSISKGGFQAINKCTGGAEFMDTSISFKM